MSLSPSRVIPFMRNGQVPPAIVQVRMTPVVTMTAGAELLIAENVTAFTVTNPNPFAVWFKGGVGPAPATAPDPTGNGNFIPPGAQITQSSIRPDWLVAVPADSLLAPLRGDDGNLLFDMSKAYMPFVFGSGL